MSDTLTGRDLDAAVAALLGGGPDTHEGWLADFYDDRPKRYSTDIAAAWEVVEELRRRGWLVTVKALPPGFPFRVQGDASEYGGHDPGGPLPGTEGKCCCEAHWMGEGRWRDEWAVADTAPEAICRAALATREDTTR